MFRCLCRLPHHPPRAWFRLEKVIRTHTFDPEPSNTRIHLIINPSSVRWSRAETQPIASRRVPLWCAHAFRPRHDRSQKSAPGTTRTDDAAQIIRTDLRHAMSSRQQALPPYARIRYELQLAQDIAIPSSQPNKLCPTSRLSTAGCLYTALSLPSAHSKRTRTTRHAHAHARRHPPPL